eukprot:CAMPEP_0170966492 /NCGR_PEP_ID=MMETSP0735-20130129/41782_1 /TAXON_ID=186038 /ORGANISM="Fragilariopsis kerguelensis, Strain L26-C5" /LENGTH=91 /DNA_ID=CAMNT_0011384515 /DNA_START=168 /DNA_END=440 /DNA_ORIENTATION=+
MEWNKKQRDDKPTVYVFILLCGNERTQEQLIKKTPPPLENYDDDNELQKLSCFLLFVVPIPDRARCKELPHSKSPKEFRMIQEMQKLQNST